MTANENVPSETEAETEVETKAETGTQTIADATPARTESGNDDACEQPPGHRRFFEQFERLSFWPTWISGLTCVFAFLMEMWVVAWVAFAVWLVVIFFFGGVWSMYVVIGVPIQLISQWRTLSWADRAVQGTAAAILLAGAATVIYCLVRIAFHFNQMQA